MPEGLDALAGLIARRARALVEAGHELDTLRPHAARLRRQAPALAEDWSATAASVGRELHELLTLDGGLIAQHLGVELERSLGLYVDGPDGPILAGTWNLAADELEHLDLRPLASGGWLFGLPGGLGLAGIGAAGHGVIANHLCPATARAGLPGAAVLLRLLELPRLTKPAARAVLEADALIDGRNWMLADGLSFLGFEHLGDRPILTRVGRKTGHIHANHCFDPALRQLEARPRSPESFRRLELASTIYVQRRPATATQVLAFFAEVEQAAFCDARARAQASLVIELGTGRALWRRRPDEPTKVVRFETPLRVEPS